MNRARVAPTALHRGGTSAWLSADAVARVCHGEVLRSGAPCSSALCDGIATDTRLDCTGKLFVALAGERHDAHDHLHQAIAAGALGLLVERPLQALAPDLCASRGEAARAPFVVRVADTARALLDLAAEHRRRHRARVVGITGSCGKTTTKEWLGAMLASVLPTVRSQGSFNNHVGVPLTLFQIGPETRAAVVELGTNHPGEIAMLCDVAQPEVAIVTCVANAHLQGLGSLAGVAAEKGALPEALPSAGLCLLNADDHHCMQLADRTSATVQFFSASGAAVDWFATEVRTDLQGTSFLLRGKLPVRLPCAGEHLVGNALAAIAAANWLGVPEAAAIEALAQAPCAPRRLQRKTVRGITLLDDTYNMNPASAHSALGTLAAVALPGARRIVVFGAMKELGDQSAPLHAELGAAVALGGFEKLLCVGADANAIAQGALQAGMDPAAVERCDGVLAALATLQAQLAPGDFVLCKASHSVGLDRLVDGLMLQERS